MASVRARCFRTSLLGPSVLAVAAAVLSARALVGTPSHHLPAGWSRRDVGICAGRLAPAAAAGCVVLPAYKGECAFPLAANGSYAADACAKWPGCEAVTCGPLAAGEPVAWCFARSQSIATCSVPGYYSFAAFPPPPPPPPPFRLAAIYGDHMVLQRGPARAQLWGHATPGAVVSAAVAGHSVGTAPGGASRAPAAEARVRYTARSAPANASGVWVLSLPATNPSPASSVHTVTLTSSKDAAPLVVSDVLFGEVWLV